MARRLLTTHLRDEEIGRSTLHSVVGHILVLAVVAGLGFLLPSGLLIDLGSTPGGGQGESIIPVGLAASVDQGGFGNVKPAVLPAPKAAPPPEKPAPPPPQEDPKAFVEKPKPQSEPPKKLPSDRPPIDPPKAPKPKPGDVVRQPDPGAGKDGRPAPGVGGGIGAGVGLEVGDGRNSAPGIDSYYVRLVERRVGENWLRTSLGDLGREVETVFSFEVDRSGRISDIRLVAGSGLRSVDLAAERAIRASNPLPPLPPEFRGRSVRFRSEFRYPPLGGKK